jgi:hypothetical protein
LDQYDVTDDSIDDVKGEVRRVVKKFRDEMEKSRHQIDFSCGPIHSSGDEFEVHFKGDAGLLNCKVNFDYINYNLLCTTTFVVMMLGTSISIASDLSSKIILTFEFRPLICTTS